MNGFVRFRHAGCDEWLGFLNLSSRLPLPTPERIQEAIQACVARCKFHDAPLACIAEFIDKLRADPTWNEPAVARVETAARKILARLIDPQ
jgi:hypothetical protein